MDKIFLTREQENLIQSLHAKYRKNGELEKDLEDMFALFLWAYELHGSQYPGKTSIHGMYESIRDAKTLFSSLITHNTQLF